jgi:hypothetical protein
MRDPRQREQGADGNDQGAPDELESLETIQDLEPTEDDADRIAGGVTCNIITTVHMSGPITQ